MDGIRRQYLTRLHNKTGRNIIAYYSGWLSKPRIEEAAISDEDKNGFMMALHGLKKDDLDKGLDLILHTPGGSMAATESIVDYLRRKFSTNIRAIVPQIAMSAGTMIACSCREIWMARHANLGPIDPHFGRLPAHGVIQEFKRALRECKRDPSRLGIWQAIIRQYPPAFIGQCENAKKWAAEFVQKELVAAMFENDPKAVTKAKKIVKKLSDFSGNRAHDRHVHYDECLAMDLNVHLIETDQEFQDLVLTVHHCYMHTLMNSPAFKIIENHLGIALMKNQAIAAVPAG